MDKVNAGASVSDTIKLARFKEIIINDAKARCESILREVEEIKKSRLSKAETEILERTYRYIQDEMAAIQSENKRQVSQEVFESKRTLLSKRDEVVRSVFADVEQKLRDFTATSEYEQLLIRRAKEAREQLGDIDIVVYLRGEDMRFEDSMRAALGGACEVKTDDTQIVLGGVLFSSAQKHMMIDETFDSKIAEQHAHFIEMCGLSFE